MNATPAFVRYLVASTISPACPWFPPPNPVGMLAEFFFECGDVLVRWLAVDFHNQFFPEFISSFRLFAHCFSLTNG